MKEVLRILRAHVMSDLDYNVIRPVAMILAGAAVYGLGYLAVSLIDPSHSTAISAVWTFCVLLAVVAVVYAFVGFVLLVYRCMIKLPPSWQ